MWPVEPLAITMYKNQRILNITYPRVAKTWHQAALKLNDRIPAFTYPSSWITECKVKKLITFPPVSLLYSMYICLLIAVSSATFHNRNQFPIHISNDWHNTKKLWKSRNNQSIGGNSTKKYQLTKTLCTAAFFRFQFTSYSHLHFHFVSVSI